MNPSTDELQKESLFQNHNYYWVRKDMASQWMIAQWLNGKWLLCGGETEFDSHYFGMVEKHPVSYKDFAAAREVESNAWSDGWSIGFKSDPDTGLLKGEPRSKYKAEYLKLTTSENVNKG